MFYCICPNFPLLLSPAPPHPPHPAPHSQSPHCCPCPWVIYTCSLTRSFPFFPPSLLPCPSGHYQSVPCLQRLMKHILCTIYCPHSCKVKDKAPFPYRTYMLEIWVLHGNKTADRNGYSAGRMLKWPGVNVGYGSGRTWHFGLSTFG